MKIAKSYYSNLLGTPNSSPYPGTSHVAEYISKHISQDQANSLIESIIDEEVFGTLKSMKRNKSPGLDGFNVNFFIHFWDVMGPDLIRALKYFFESSHMLLPLP